MTTEFEADLQSAVQDLDSAWKDLLKLVRSLSDEDLERGSRGEWTVGAVLHHVLGSQWLYRHLVRQLRSQETAPLGEAPPPAQSVEEVVDRLIAAREAVRESIQGVDEEAFYTLRDTDHHQQYSLKSLLADNARHNREHHDQIKGILTSPKS